MATDLRDAGSAARPPGDEATNLLFDLGAALHAAAIPADVAEQRLNKVAAAFGINADIVILQGFFAIELRRAGAERVELRRIPFDTHWNLTQAAALTELTKTLGEGKMDVAAGRAALARILGQRNPYPPALIALAWAVYGGVVAVRVGGRWTEMLAAMFIGLCAVAVHFATGSNKNINLEKSFLGAFLGSLAAFALAMILPPFDYPRALFGGISLLVPAMVVTIGVHELANEALESGTVRLVYGLLCFALLAGGITAAFTLSDGLFHVMPPHVTATKLPDLVVLGFVAVGGLALVVCLQARPRDVFWIVAATVVAFGAQELTRLLVGDKGAPTVAAFLLGAVAYLHGRLPGHVPFTMIVPGLLQLAPGFLGTEATFKMIDSAQATRSGTFFDVILVAVQLGLGILVAGLVFRKRKPHARITPAAAGA